MGYTHYYYVPKQFDKKSFESVVADFSHMLKPLEHLGVKLADGMGQGKPVINKDEIIFNGLEKCGHKEHDLGIAWPSDNAKGIADIDLTLSQITKSGWFAGQQLETRVCGGDCSHETFSLERKLETTMTRYDGSTWELESENEKYFQCTKTAYKPYDLAVTVCLVIAKHYFKDQITIHSDGTRDNFLEAMSLCQHFLGYGNDFVLDGDEN